MLIRIVKLTLKEENAKEFEQTAKANHAKIIAFEGCQHLEMYKDTSQPFIFFTYSQWKDENALNNYRNSTLFKSIWANVKPWFAAKAEAWSVQNIN